MKHLQTIWLIMAQFKAFTRGRLHPTLPLAEKRLWSSHSGKAQLSKKGKPDYMTQHQNGGQIQIQISGGHCIKPFYQYVLLYVSFEQMHAWLFDSFYFTATHFQVSPTRPISFYRINLISVHFFCNTFKIFS